MMTCRGLARAIAAASSVALLFVACTGGPEATEFSRGTPIPLGPITLTVSEVAIRSQSEHETFHVVFNFGGITFPAGHRWIVVLLRSPEIDTFRKMERFLAAFNGKLTLVDRAGHKYGSVPLMDLDTYLFYLRAPARRYEQKLTALTPQELYALRQNANVAPADLQGLRSFMDIRVNMMIRIREEEGGIRWTPVPQEYVAMFSVPPGNDGFALFIENPEPREGLRVAKVPLGL
jgi:hypothetical protein